MAAQAEASQSGDAKKEVSYASISEGKFARDVAAAIRAWREAGKPHKR